MLFNLRNSINAMILIPSSNAGVGDGASGDGVVVVTRVDWGILEVSLTVLSSLLLPVTVNTVFFPVKTLDWLTDCTVGLQLDVDVTWSVIFSVASDTLIPCDDNSVLTSTVV